MLTSLAPLGSTNSAEMPFRVDSHSSLGSINLLKLSYLFGRGRWGRKTSKLRDHARET
jgi:hypothetical protein